MTVPAVSVPKPIKYLELSEEQRDLIKRTIGAQSAPGRQAHPWPCSVAP